MIPAKDPVHLAPPCIIGTFRGAHAPRRVVSGALAGNFFSCVLFASLLLVPLLTPKAKAGDFVTYEGASGPATDEILFF